MAQRRRKAARDVERDYPARQFVAKLRRLADCIEGGAPFRIQIAGERIAIPAHARIQLEHERGDGEEEVEFQLRWAVDTAPGSAAPAATRRRAGPRSRRARGRTRTRRRARRG